MIGEGFPASMTCGVCGGEVTVVALTAEGSSASCPCGRTRLTTLNQGHIDLAPKPNAPELAGGAAGDQP